jgi:phytoene dehydrogenase-like protein
MNKKRNKKIIVVGGGVGGLAAAALLSKETDLEVTLYEKRMLLGGRARSRKTGGYTLDLGLHGFRGADNGPAAKVLKRLGKEIQWATRYSNGILPKFYYEGRLVDFPDSLLQTLTHPLLNIEEKFRLITFFRRLTNTDPDELNEVSVNEWLQKIGITQKRLIEILKISADIGYFSDIDFGVMSAGELVRFLQTYPYDVGFPVGGCKQVNDKLTDSIRENGGYIVTGRKVDRIIIRDGIAEGVVVDGRKDESDAIVLNVPLKELPSLLPADCIPEQFKKILQDYETSAGIVIDVAVSQEIIPDEEPYDTVVSIDPHAILRVSSKYDHTLAPHGKHLFTAWMPIMSGKVYDHTYVQGKFSELEKLVGEQFPSLLEDTEFRRKMVFDTVIGAYPKIGQSKNTRPSITLPGISNLYLAGDAINAPGIGGSSDAAFNSAMLSADLIERQHFKQSEKENGMAVTI